MSGVRLELEVAGVVRTVQVERTGGGYVVLLDGRRFELDAAEIEPGRWSLIFGDGASHDVRIQNGQPGAWTVSVGGTIVAVAARDPRRARGSGGAAGDGPARVTAPMPGKVIRVLVSPGDAVGARQGVVVVEAMKMENELRAQREGVVREVLVQPGALVEAGAPLLTIE